MKKWKSSDIGDQNGKIVIVTGANSGIGFETARCLALNNAEVIMACRNAEKCNLAAKAIKEEYPQAKLCVMPLDLSDLASVKRFAQLFQEKYDQLHILINNAGVMVPPYSKTKDGFELQFGVNHLGHFALTAQLFQTISKTKSSRIVNVSSMAHKNGGINFDDLHWQTRKYNAWKAYGDSKISNLYFTYELARKINQSGTDVLSVAAHPGWTATNLQRNSTFFNFLNPYFAQNIPQGALPTLYAATVDNVENGDFYGPDGFMEMKGHPKKTKSNRLSQDKNIANRLWKVSEELTNISFKTA